MNVIISGIALTALLGACITVALSDKTLGRPIRSSPARSRRDPRF